MKATRLSSRYAKSLLSLVVEQNKLEDTLSDMKRIVSVCSENKDLSLLLKSPIIKTDKNETLTVGEFLERIEKLKVRVQ